MSDFQEQLAILRRRIAKIDQKYARPARERPPAVQALDVCRAAVRRRRVSLRGPGMARP